ncbi:N-hydroxyarylamine O-acetyltransferase [Microdochium nivale]|nr:N-hydroxyarylamine O-acetyltransferase [Microdochium nivale]
MASSDSDPIALTQLALDADSRPRFSSAELQDYFARIGLPQAHLDSPVLQDATQARTREHGLPFLHALTLYHVCSITFDNLVLHYSPHRTVTLDQAELHARIVRSGRGGRCMEQNSLLATVLRSLGFEVRNCAGRVARAMSPYSEVRANQAQTYDGWNHMLDLVALDGEWYVVDVGMGAMGPNCVYPLRDGFEAVSVAPRRIRLQHRPIPESYASGAPAGAPPPKLWCYDVCHKPAAAPADNEWTPVYCFTEVEFLPQDYEMMSWFTSTHPRSFFTRYVTCSKMLMGPVPVGDGDAAGERSGEAIVGNITLFKDAVRETIGSTRRIVKECKTEAERVQVLADLFGVHLTEAEKEGIPAARRLGEPQSDP